MLKQLILLSLVLAVSAFPFATKRIYFTTNAQYGAPSLDSTFYFNTIWTSMGVGKNGHIYTAVSDMMREGSGDTSAKGNACVVDYNPYDNTIKSCHTVKAACGAVNNWLSNESQQKIHTPLLTLPDGKIWMATHDYDGIPDHFYRGSHLMYVDPENGDTLVDYSKDQKYYYKKDEAKPTLMDHTVPASDTSGVAVQWHAIINMGANPWCPRYLWTMALGNGRVQVWDIVSDTTRSVSYSDGSLREFAVSRTGSIYYNDAQFATRRTVSGASRIVGRNMPGYLGCLVYTHSRDSAYGLVTCKGQLLLYDMLHDTVKQVADFPDGQGAGDPYGGDNTYRSMAVSRDGTKLYIIGAGWKLYEYTIATGQYQVLQDLADQLSDQYFVHSRSIVDTLGNWYIGIFNGRFNGASLLQIGMGKELVIPIHIPDPDEITVEKIADEVAAQEPGLDAAPNPFNPSTRLIFRSNTPLNGGTLTLYTAGGKSVASFPVDGERLRNGVVWSAAGMSSGVYMARLCAENGLVFTRTLVLLR